MINTKMKIPFSFSANSKWGLATTLILYVSSAVAAPFFAMRWQLLKKRAG